MTTRKLNEASRERVIAAARLRTVEALGYLESTLTMFGCLTREHQEEFNQLREQVKAFVDLHNTPLERADNGTN